MARQRAELVKKDVINFGVESVRLSTAGVVETESESKKIYSDYTDQSWIPLEQFQTRMIVRIVRKDYVPKAGTPAPEIKVIESEGGK